MIFYGHATTSAFQGINLIYAPLCVFSFSVFFLLFFLLMRFSGSCGDDNLTINFDTNNIVPHPHVSCCYWKVFCFCTHMTPGSNTQTHTGHTLSHPSSGDILHFIGQTRDEIRVAGNHRIHRHRQSQSHRQCQRQRRQYVCLPAPTTAVDMRAFWPAMMSCTACLAMSPADLLPGSATRLRVIWFIGRQADTPLRARRMHGEKKATKLVIMDIFLSNSMRYFQYID